MEIPRTIQVRVSDDSAKRDHELWCLACEEHLCDVEHGDELGILVDVAMDHVASCVGTSR
jgi:hypothetical protein